MKKIFTLAMLFAAVSMVACGGEEKKEQQNEMDKALEAFECAGACDDCGYDCDSYDYDFDEADYDYSRYYGQSVRAVCE